MDTDFTIEQLEMFNKTYEWIISETSKIQKEILKLKDSEFGTAKHLKLEKDLDELQNRYSSNKDHYNKIIEDIKKYFEDKHNIDIMNFVKELDNEA